MPRAVQPNRLRRHLIYVVVIATTFLILFPVYYLFLTSLKPTGLLFAIPPRFLFKPTFQGYVDLFYKSRYYSYYLNSIVVATVSALLALLLGGLGAFAFTNLRFSGKRFWFFLVLITRMYPPVTTIIPVYFMINRMGLSDTRIALILLYTAFQIPMVVWIMTSFFAEIPKEVRESALLDGCSVGRLFHSIVFPLALPGAIASGILVFALNWNEFLFSLVLTSRYAKTAPVALMAFLESEGMVQWGSVSVLGFATILPTLIFMVVLNRFLVKGLMVGAVKG